MTRNLMMCKECTSIIVVNSKHSTSLYKKLRRHLSKIKPTKQPLIKSLIRIGLEQDSLLNYQFYKAIWAVKTLLLSYLARSLCNIRIITNMMTGNKSCAVHMTSST